MDPIFFESFYYAEPKLLQLDVDSTLIEQEAIELLGRFAGQEVKIRAITDAAMRGDIGFEESLAERVKLLEGLPSEAMGYASDELTLSPGARKLITAYKEAGHYVGLCSGGFSQLLNPLAQQLGVDYAVANTLEVMDGVITGKLAGKTIVTAEMKARILREKSQEFRLDISHSIAVGDGANDINMLRSAGVGVAYQAKPALRQIADVILDGPDLSLLTVLDSRTNAISS